VTKGNNINAKTGDGVTPLHLAAFEGRADVVELLVAAGADVNAPDNDGDRPIHYAARRGHNAVVAMLEAKGAVSDATVESLLKIGATPLHQAAAMGDLKQARALLAQGANVNAKDRLDARPLYYAAEKGRKDVIELLLAHGAAVHARNTRRHETALEAATRVGHKDAAELLKAADTSSR
jgi:ankyrin